ncbi:unnamed protein product [Paramecium octaurelia]|uniref:Uncharacterized protein n=1 Tax=Paramecium octaurelia TaxID=43137 RepID=A0A8S1UAA0_PAROT|nr:unnamed protein product [Paramecium octaurelia]
MISNIKSQRGSREKYNQELPFISHKKSFTFLKNGELQSSQQSIHKKGIKSQFALDTLFNYKLVQDSNTSPVPTSQKSYRYDRASFCTFFPNKKALPISNEISLSLKSMSYKENSLMQMLNQIAFIINELRQFKSEKGLISIIEKEINQNSRFQELSFLFLNAKMTDLVQSELMFKRIYKKFTYIQDNRVTIKRNKLDQSFLQILNDFLNKLEEQYRKINELQFLGLQESMKSSRIKLQNKELEMQTQFTSQEKREACEQLQQFFKYKFSLNKRILESKLSQDINQLEERNGIFKHINKNNRFISNQIDDILKNII